MTRHPSRTVALRVAQLLMVALLVFASAEAAASTINQNTSWIIDKAKTNKVYRVTAYGDSIFAGYYGNYFNVAKRAAPYVLGEYLSNQWNADVEVVRRAKSGAKADDINNNKIVAEASYMQDATTRVVMFEMCGNDFLQARSAFADQGAGTTCNYAPVDAALAACGTYTERAMQFINANASANAKTKMVMNIYYPGFDADNVMTACNDPTTGAPINKRDKFLPYLAKSNWKTCSLAAANGFKCVDVFADHMAADYDSNGDGRVDSQALRYVPGETEAAYVTRVTQTLASTLRDANTHLVNATTSYDYLLSDNTHQTYWGSATMGNGDAGKGAAEFANSDTPNAAKDQRGHERAGWAHKLLAPATP